MTWQPPRGAMNGVLAPLVPVFRSLQKWLDANAGVPTTEAPFRGCILRSTSNTSIPSNTATVLPFDIEDKDTNDFHTSFASTRITIPSGLDATYMIGGSVALQALSGTKKGLIFFRLNGTTNLGPFRQEWVQGGSSSVAPVWQSSSAWPRALVAGDYVELGIFHDDSTSRAVFADRCVFWVWKIAPS